MLRRFVLPFVLALNACVPVTPGDVTTRALPQSSDLPPMKTFGSPTPGAPIRSNNDLALDFIELSFQLESGRDLPYSHVSRGRFPCASPVRRRPRWEQTCVA